MSDRGKLVGMGLIIAAFFAANASCRRKSESEVIAGLVAELAVRAEKRDAAGLIAHLAGNFRDGTGRDRERTAALIEEYFSRYRGIVIHVLASRIVVDGPGSASLETDVSLSSGAAQAFRKLIRFSGENYRFRCRLRKNGRWLITEAEWEYVPVESLFPESLKLFRELFPNL